MPEALNLPVKLVLIFLSVAVNQRTCIGGIMTTEHNNESAGADYTLPAPLREERAAEPTTPDGDPRFLLDDDIQTLKAKLKGYQTLGKFEGYQTLGKFEGYRDTRHWVSLRDTRHWVSLRDTRHWASLRDTRHWVSLKDTRHW